MCFADSFPSTMRRHAFTANIHGNNAWIAAMSTSQVTRTTGGTPNRIGKQDSGSKRPEERVSRQEHPEREMARKVVERREANPHMEEAKATKARAKGLANRPSSCHPRNNHHGLHHRLPHRNRQRHLPVQWQNNNLRIGHQSCASKKPIFQRKSKRFSTTNRGNKDSEPRKRFTLQSPNMDRHANSCRLQEWREYSFNNRGGSTWDSP